MWTVYNDDKSAILAAFAYPAPDAMRSVDEYRDRMSHEVWLDLESAVHDFNSGRWAPCVNACRKLLECVYRDLVPEAVGQRLVRQIQTGDDESVWARRVAEAADALRNAGNKGSHGDTAPLIDQDFAAATLDLTQELVLFAYEWPGAAKRLNDAVDELESQRAASDLPAE